MNSDDFEKKRQTHYKIESLLGEARMVLPGVVALFGFQLIAVFSEAFRYLDSSLKQVHFFSLILTTLSICFLVAPASYHRITQPKEETEEFVDIASKLLLTGMIPLVMAICINIFVLSQIILGSTGISLLIAFLLLFNFISFWFLFAIRKKK